MPKLVRLYIFQVLIGFGLSAIFVGLLLYLNVANLWHLVSTTSGGLVAVVMLFIFNGIVFAGVQFSITIMHMAGNDKPGGGKKSDLPSPQRLHLPKSRLHPRDNCAGQQTNPRKRQ